MADPNSRLVYSTDGGRIVQKSPSPPPRRRQGQAPSRPPLPEDGFVRILREKKGRGGKTVTLVAGLSGGVSQLDAVLKDLKQHCGAGGTRDGAMLEIQGDHRARIEARLVAQGHRVKIAGG